MILSEIQSNLYRRLNFSDTPDTSVTTRLTMFMNERYRRLMTSPALKHLRTGFGQFDTVASQAEYGLSYSVERILGIRETTNDRTLGMRSFEWWRQYQADPADNTGTPDTWVPIGTRACFKRPDGNGVWVVSDSAADVAVVVTILAAQSNSVPRGLNIVASVTLTGTSRVRIGSVGFDDIISISTSAAPAGNLSFWDAAAAGNQLSAIPSGNRIAKHVVIALSPTPASAITYQYDYEHRFVDLSNAWDEPRLPENFHDLLITGALLDEYQHRDDTRYGTVAQEYAQRLGEMKAFLYNHRAATQKGPRPELAPLGAWFPAQYS